MALGDALDDLIDKGINAGFGLGESWLKDILGIGGTPLERLKSNIGGYARTSRFAVLITPPAGMSRSSTEIENITMACTSVSGLMYSFGSSEVRHGEGIPRKMPNDEIYPDITLSFNNTIVFGRTNALTFWEEWMKLVKNQDGFGFYDDYVSVAQVQQYNDKGKLIKEYKLTNFYPISIIPDALSHSSSDTIQTFQIIASWF